MLRGVQMLYYAPNGSVGSVGLNQDLTFQFTPTMAGVYRIVMEYLNGLTRRPTLMTWSCRID